MEPTGQTEMWMAKKHVAHRLGDWEGTSRIEIGRTGYESYIEWNVLSQVLTLPVLVDTELCGRCHRLSDAIFCDTFECAVVPVILDWLNAQYGAMRHLNGEVALAAIFDATSALAPVDLRGRVTWRLTEKADCAILLDLCVLRGEGDSGCIWNRWQGMVKILAQCVVTWLGEDIY